MADSASPDWLSATTIGERLEKLRGDRSLVEFGGLLGVHPQTIRNYELDKRSPDASFLAALLAAFEQKLNLNWLLGNAEHPFDNNVDLSEATGPDLVFIPRYEISASAGVGLAVSEENVVDYLAFKAAWVRDHIGIAPSKLALIGVTGDSMEPTLIRGDLVLIDTTATTVSEDAIYVLCDGDILVVKRLQRFLGGRIMVRSDNPSYESYELTPDMDGVRIIGRVRWFGREL